MADLYTMVRDGVCNLALYAPISVGVCCMYLMGYRAVKYAKEHGVLSLGTIPKEELFGWNDPSLIGGSQGGLVERMEQ